MPHGLLTLQPRGGSSAERNTGKAYSYLVLLLLSVITHTPVLGLMITV